MKIAGKRSFAPSKPKTYVRGKITILERAGLENVSCECYFATQKFYSEVMKMPE